MFYQIRLPRTLLVILSGGALSLGGMVYQGVFRNPLVSPDVLGVSSGCSLGAIVAMIFFSSQGFLAQGFAFVGGLTVVGLALMLSRAMGDNPILALVIAGIIASALVSSVIMMLKYTVDPYQLPAIEFWLMGGFHQSSWPKLWGILPIITLATLILFVLKWPLNVLRLGDEEATTLGVAVGPLRIIALGCATFLVAAVVSVAGLVSWIGLIAPHLTKLYVGDDLNHAFPLSLPSGSSLLLLADILARTLLPMEIPISILTTLVGAPFLAYLFWKKGGQSRWNS